MDVIGSIELADEPQLVRARRYHAGGAHEDVDNSVQAETVLDVFVNDVHTMKIGCSASYLDELVIGRLFSEGLVWGTEEIEVVSVCANSMRADVHLRNRQADLTRPPRHLVATTSSSNQTLNDYFGTREQLSPVEPIEWDPEWIFRMAREFHADKTAHARTRGVHSAYLATPEATLCLREDIGRHNAFDKVVGWALLHDVDLTHCLLFTSGRVPIDMVTKAIRARIPILVSKAVATDKTIRLARELNLTLICSATPASFDLML